MSRVVRGLVPPSASEVHQGLAFASGGRVLDLVEGEPGIIISGSAQHLVTAPGQINRLESYSVKHDAGDLVTRTAAQLAALPANLTSEYLAGEPASTLAAQPAGIIPAGRNAGAVIAAELKAGRETLAQQLSSGNPGIPEPGSLEYADWKRRGLIP